MLSVKVTPPVGDLTRRMADGRRATPRILREAVAESVAIMLGNLVEATPVGATGHLRGGYSPVVEANPLNLAVRGLIVNPILYHDIRERGRNPGRPPPVDALIPWVGTKLGVPVANRRQVAYLVARKIGRRGYPGSDHVRIAWRASRARIRHRLGQVGATVGRATFRP